MVLKLFKHDFKRIARFGVPCLIALVCITIFGFINVRFLTNVGETSFTVGSEGLSNAAVLGTYLSIWGIFGVVLSLCAVASIMSVVIYHRFYKSFVSDEAYLNLTLPVTPARHIIAKLLSAILWSLITGVGVVLSVIVIVPEMPTEIVDFIRMTAEKGIVWDAGSVVFVVLTVLLMIVSAVEGLLQIFAAILVGASLSGKYKGIAAVGAVIAANMLVNFIVSFISSGLSMIYDLPSVGHLIISGTEISAAAMNIYLLIQICIYLALAAAFFLITRYCIAKNKCVE